MKIVTVKQPWAWLIVHGHKDIENRSYATRTRGPLLIQSSARRPPAYDWDCAAAYARERGIELPPPEEMQFGGVVGIVQVTACVRQHSSPWFQGPVGWVLSGARTLPFVAVRGQRVVFDAPAEVMARLKLPIASLPLLDP